jgi:hypothetical protein
MVTIWQNEYGSQPEGFGLEIRRFLKLSVANHTPNPQGVARALAHRNALLKLGYLTTRRFELPPVIVGTADYNELCEKVGPSNLEKPTAQFAFDQTARPQRVIGLVVYATPNEMAEWEKFMTNLAGHPGTH